MTCSFCNRVGHEKRNCYFLKPCLHCGKTGHSSHMCYTLNNNNNNNMSNNNMSNRVMSNNNTNTFVPRHFGSTPSSE